LPRWSPRRPVGAPVEHHEHDLGFRQVWKPERLAADLHDGGLGPEPAVKPAALDAQAPFVSRLDASDRLSEQPVTGDDGVVVDAMVEGVDLRTELPKLRSAVVIVGHTATTVPTRQQKHRHRAAGRDRNAPRGSAACHG
jgi:hypothetical protein